MGSMGRIKFSRLEMFRINSSVDDQIVDHVQYVADEINEVMNEECSGDKFASVKDLREACRACYSPVPTGPRTPRIFIENQTYNPEEGVYYCSDEMIVDEKNSSPSKKHSRDEDFIVSDDDYEDFMVSDDAGCEDFIVSDDDYDDEEESFSKKRQKKVERKTKVPRKPVPVLYNLPSELPQNLQEYISRLNLEAPPLFVAQKLLYVSDVTSQQSRLLLPRTLINAEFFDNFLTKVEKEMLDKKAIQVNLVDDKLREFNDLRMKKWIMTSSKEYILQKVWNQVVAENNLGRLNVSKDNDNFKIAVMRDDDRWKTDVVVMLWCFRRESKIWFAFHIQAMTEFTILGVKLDSDGSKRYIIK